MTKRRKLRRDRSSQMSSRAALRRRRLHHQSLERRELLAADIEGPRLIGINPNAGEIFDDDSLNQLDQTPSELTFRFDGGQQLDPGTLDGIQLTRSGGDNVFGDANDQQIVPGFLGFGENDQTVVMRFAENLPDDRYRIEILGSGSDALRDVEGDGFRTIDGEDYQAIDFDVEIGGKVIAVVPQPVEPVDGQLQQRGDQIDVYFDDPDLFRSGSNVDTPEFYQLVATGESVTTEDDQVFTPQDVATDAATQKVTLTFDKPLEDLTGAGGTTSFRLRVGNDADFGARVVERVTGGADPGATADSAHDLTSDAASATVGGSWSVVVDGQQIRNSGVRALADNPGASDEPGHRDIEVDGERHLFFDGPSFTSGDSDNGISQIEYTFLKNDSYGENANGDPVFTQINADQERRFREILELYSEQFGIDFVETEDSGLRLIVGDLFTADPGRVSGKGGVAGLGGPGGVTMDYLDFQDDVANQPNNGFFQVALHEVGHAIGLGHAYDLDGSLMGSGGTGNWVFPQPDDVAHGRHLHQREALDVDMYRIDVAEAGRLQVQTNAERLIDSSQLDSQVSLYRENASGEVELVAQNDDYFGSDSFLEQTVQPGTYFVGVAAKGNNAFDPDSEIPAEGGVSEGDYELRLEFKPTGGASTIVDADGSQLDGDRDGLAGGNYNFWFEASADTIYVRKPDSAADSGGDGTLADPVDNIDDALAMAAAAGGAVVRVLANDGTDNDVTTTADNAAYEFGRISSLGQTLEDGRNLVVPANTTLMIDAGSILKFLDARVSVGSDDDGVNRSGSSIQVLGTPQLPVHFTSYNDPGLGRNVNPVDDTPASGDWGGIEVRNDVDRAQGRADAERRGIFQNYINHAQIEFGGGNVTSVDDVIDPIQLSEARAEISYNTIRDSATNAVSADPGTFELSTFTAPRFQRASESGDGFVPDYARVGPSIHGNVLTGNSTNGLFVRIDTLAGQELEKLRVAARFDDTDIVHVLGESLIVEGRPGGPIEHSTPATPFAGLQAIDAGADPGLDSGTYRYTYTLVDANGLESRPSVPEEITVGGSQDAVQLFNIPAATGDFVGRRLYRSKDGGAFRLVAELDRTRSGYVDRVATPADSAPTIDPFAGEVVRGRPDASLVIDSGTIVKSQGARVELDYGTALLAEGREGREVVFTSRSDDRYGAGGTFDTNDDGAPAASGGRFMLGAGEWAGIYAGRHSRLSLDHSVVAHGGGVTGVEGSTAGFNPVEIHQADARVANTLFENNTDGRGGQATAAREGRGPNSAATIHVTGAQPVIVGNTFIDNDGAAINLNAGSMNSDLIVDGGRQTGPVDRFAAPPANEGPLVRGNRLIGNEINGMEIRGEAIFEETVWDDTDIVHVLRGNITTDNFHVSGGFRLESSATESLVVKLDGGAEIIADGYALDIDDRIGGRIQVLGSPGFPVIMTSLRDDTVGAGFTPYGQPQTSTLRSGGAPSAGDWQGLTLREGSHDRNVDATAEREGEIGGFGDQNAVIGNHQRLGTLAPNERSGDENRRLGFTVHGAIAAGKDQDIYSFRGTAGSMVWLDIDHTDRGLDTVLEFLDGDGNVLALSDGSRSESIDGALTYVNPIDPDAGDNVGFEDGHALPMNLDPDADFNAAGGGHRDLYSLNDGDAGMRVVLPGSEGTTRTYYVRVRSHNGNDLSDASQVDQDLDGGQTSGGYQLQIRLHETDEIGGSVVRYADLRYASTAILAAGLPAHSPLASEYATDGDADLGNIGNSDRAAISIAGEANEAGDSFSFVVHRDRLQNAGGSGNRDNKISTVFDVDWADGLTRPNTSMFLYHDDQLVAIGTDSNILDDRVTPSSGGLESTTDVLDGASFGSRDAFIGPLELSEFGQYEVVVSTNQSIAHELSQFTDPDSPYPLLRLEPLDSTVRISDDRFTIDVGDEEPDVARRPETLQVAFEDDGSNILPWHFGDLPLIALREDANNAGAARLSIYNPFTGRHDAIINRQTGAKLATAAQRPDGVILAIRKDGNDPQNDSTTSTVYQIDVEGNETQIGGTGISTYEHFLTTGNNPNDINRLDNEGMEFASLAYFNSNDDQDRFLYGLAHRGDFDGISVVDDGNGNDEVGPGVARNADNLIYLLDPDNGTALSRGGRTMTGGYEAADPTHPRIQNNYNNFAFPAETPWAGTDVVAQVQIPTTSPATGDPTGQVNTIMTAVDNSDTLYAFTDRGAVWEMDINRGDTRDYNPGDIDGAPTLLIDPTVNSPVGGTDFIADAKGNSLVFEQVTKGPANFSDPNVSEDLGDLYFGVGRTGSPGGLASGALRLYAFDLTNRTAEPVFEFGADSVLVDSTGAAGEFGGLFFSPLDQNLWHLSDTLENAPGHGFTGLDAAAREGLEGGGSLRFGFDPLDDDYNHLGPDSVESSPEFGSNDLDASDMQGFTGYNFIGGAHGNVQSNRLDLTGIASEDQPHLYFTYLLDTEGRNSGNDLSQNPMRDSLRVFVSDQNGDWSLVATNNFDQSVAHQPTPGLSEKNPNFDFNPTDDAVNPSSPGEYREYDPDNSHYGDKGNDRRFVQELFDGDQFRQARIDLGPWAGQDDVRIRFEFSTAGESRPDQSEIFAVPASEIADGHTLTLSGEMPDKNSTNLGDALVSTSRTFEFTFDGTVSGTNVPVEIEPGDDATEVAETLQQALANEIRFADATDDGNGNYPVASFPLSESNASIRVFDLELSQSTTGRGLRLITGERTDGNNDDSNLPVNDFGVYQDAGPTLTRLLRAGERSKGLGGDNGVYIDDIIIGLAERGESVGGYLDPGTPTPPASQLVDNPHFEPRFNDTIRPEIKQGEYQLEIRAAREYGDPANQNANDLHKLSPALVELNERLATGLNLRVESTGAEIADGDTFDLSNGVETLTFEFSVDSNVTPGNIRVNFDPADTAAEVAQSIRNAINSPVANSALQIVATTTSGKTRDVTRLNGNRNTQIDVDPVIALHGFAASDNLGDLDFGSHLAAELLGTDSVVGEDNGDRNRHRDQGQLIIESNTISVAADYGIRVTAGALATDGTGGDRNKPGGVQNFGTLNSRQQIPGVVIQNNLLISDSSGAATGISVDGNSDSPIPGAPSPFARVLNNTVAGWSTGIEVVDGAAPTLLNNVVIDSSNVGIRYSQPGQTVVRGTVFAGNASNFNVSAPGAGTEATFANTSDLFLNPTVTTVDLDSGSPNFYPADGSEVIDSSIENQNDRSLLVAVKDAVGIPPSPITVPDLDLAGQQRLDDPDVNNTTGQGDAIFKDRGAIDRSDTQGPQAQLLVPLDNDAEGIDNDPDATFLHLDSGVYDTFEILISEGAGIGPDSSTITPEQVVLTENGRVLEAGIDYVFGYNASARTLRLTPLSGIWRPDSVYEVLLANSPVTRENGPTIEPISDLAGNPLAPNRSSGETRFTILMPEVELDFGDAPDSYATKYEDNGARHALVNQNTPRLGRLVDGEVDAVSPSDDADAVIVVNGNVNDADDGPFSIDTVGGITVTLDEVPESGDNLSIQVDDQETIFEFISQADMDGGDAVAAGRIAVVFDASGSVDEITETLADVIHDTFDAAGEAAVVGYDEAAPDQFTLHGLDDEDGVPVGTFFGDTTTTTGLFLDAMIAERDEDAELQTDDPAAVIGYLNPNDPAGTVIPIPVVDSEIVGSELSGSAVLDAWIDFDADGQFDADEHVLDGVSVTDGVEELRVFTPDDAEEGLTWARFRISSEGSDAPDGLATDGEVEDHQVRVVAVDQPVLEDDTLSTDEDTTLVVDAGSATQLSDNDTLPSEEFVQLRYIIDAPRPNPQTEPNTYQTDHGTVVITDPANGYFEYTPDPDYHGTDSFTYRVTTQRNDGTIAAAEHDSAVVTIEVDPVNDAPAAMDQSFATLEDESLMIVDPDDPSTLDSLIGDALGDADPAFDSAPLDESNQEFQVVAISAGGVTLDSTGTLATDRGQLEAVFESGALKSLIYTPNTDFNSINPLVSPGVRTLDEFEFTIEDDAISLENNGHPAGSATGTPKTATATATIEVMPQNDPPVGAGETIAGDDGDWLAYFDNLDPAEDAAVPTEDTELTIPAEFLLTNDAVARSSAGDELLGTEISGGVTSDGQLSVTSVSLADPSLGDLTLSGDGTAVIFTPAADIYGNVAFSYDVTDQGSDQAVDGTVTSAPLTTTFDSTIFVQPVNDAPNSFERSLTLDEVVEVDTPVPASITFNAADLLEGSGSETPVDEGPTSDVDPFHEQEQSLRVVAFEVPGQMDVDAAVDEPGLTGGTGTVTRMTDTGGLLEFQFDGGEFVEGTYTPAIDYNERTPFDPVDVFSYIAEDDGATTLPSGTVLDPSLPPERSEPAEVTVTVTETNDPPVFTMPSDVVVTEDEGSVIEFDDFITEIGPAAPTALDELERQSVSFTVDVVNEPAGLMTELPEVDASGQLTLSPAADAFGYAVYEVTATDDDPDDPRSTTQTLTVTIDPVNDAPVAFDRDLTLDEAVEEDGENAVLSFTADDLLGGSDGETPVAPGDFDPALSDLYNESEQDLWVVAFADEDESVDVSTLADGTGTLTMTSDAGGELEFHFDDGKFTDGTYAPAVDYNERTPFDPVDLFTYVVSDDGQTTVPGSGFVLGTGSDVTLDLADERSEAATVTLTVTESNDPPVFSMPSEVTVTEDEGLAIEFEDFITDIAPAESTALDELERQSVSFTVDIVNEPAGLMTQLPDVDADGQLTLSPAPDAFGVAVYEVTATDDDPDDPRSTTQTLTVTIEPVNDTPVAFDRGLRVTEAVEDDGETAVLSFTADDLLSGAAGEMPVAAGDFDPTLSDLYNESEQDLWVVAFADSDESVDVSTLAGGTGVLSMTSDTGGELEFHFEDGKFTDGTYTPVIDYNERSPFDPVDLFTYVIEDDGISTLPGSELVGGGASDVRDQANLRSEAATVTLTVQQANDAPVLDHEPLVNILERDDNGVTSVAQWASNIWGGPATALDERIRQEVRFEYLPDHPDTNVPAGLFSQDPVAAVQDNSTAGAEATLSVFPAVDAVGTATIVMRAYDRVDAGAPYSPDPTFVENETLVTVTVNVQPVNDAPQLDPAELDTSESQDADTGYQVAADGTITYTLREDNTQDDGSTDQPFFIPLAADGGGTGFEYIGLLDVFDVGPANEAGSLPGGQQELDLLGLPLGTTMDTDLGGRLTRGTGPDGGDGLLYEPPQDYNNQIGGVDSFSYAVIDDSTVGGETYELTGGHFADGDLVEDRLIAINRVELNLQPVNDRPSFDTSTLYVEAAEDSGETERDNFAFNIIAGPAATATDETDADVGQSLSFQLTPLDFTAGGADDPFGDGLPQISSDGQLTFQPESDVFGEFEFEVVLTDDGAGGEGDSNRGDLNASVPVTLTIDIQPVNDPPELKDDAESLVFDLLEDDSIDIPIGAVDESPFLLQDFVVGPANEAADILPEPGGNQSLSLASPLPSLTVQNGRLTPVTDDDGAVTHLRYTPAAHFNGTDSFSYSVTDDGVTVDLGTDGTARPDPRRASGVVTLNVMPVNDAPQYSGGDDVTSDEDQGVVTMENWARNVQAGPNGAVDEINGTDDVPAQQPQFILTQVSLTDPDLFATPPSVSIDNGSATLSYETAVDANGVAVFDVQLDDRGPDDSSIGDVHISEPQRLTITVNAVNDPPQFTPGEAVTVSEDGPAYQESWASDIMPGPVTADDELASQTVTFEVDVPSDLQGLFEPGHLPSIDADGVLSFDTAPDANTAAMLNERIELQVTAVDSEGGRSAPATLALTILPADDPPIAIDDDAGTDEDSPIRITSAELLANDFDPDLANTPGEQLSVVMPGESESLFGATVSFDSATGEITYDPTTSELLQAMAPDQSLTDTFTYQLTDADGEPTLPEATVTITVAGRNDAPRVTDDLFGANADTPVVLHPLANDTDVDGTIDPESMVITLQPNSGSLKLEDDGSLIYTPNGGFTDGDLFRYTVADNLGQQSRQATVTLVAGLGPAAQPDSVVTDPGTAIEIDVTDNDNVTDEPLDPDSVEIVSGPEHGQAVVQAGGTVRYVPADGFVGADTFTYTVRDTEGIRSNEATVTVQVGSGQLQNPENPSDINADGNVTALDALLIINRLQSGGNNGGIPVQPDDQGPPYLDQNGDGVISALDALRVINTLSRISATGEGEMVAAAASESDRDGQTGLAGTVDPPAAGPGTSPDKVVARAVIEPVSAELIDLIAGDRDRDGEEEKTRRIDAALTDLL